MDSWFGIEAKRASPSTLKKAEGSKIALELAKKADVIVENFKPGVADRLGIGYEAVRKVNDKVIYCSISGFGPKGPYSDIPGYEPLIEALGSVYTEQGIGAHPLYLVLPLASYYAAMHAAFAITVALCVRHGTKVGQKVNISLFRAILHAQRLTVLDYTGRFRIPWAPTGLMPPYRSYQCKDGKWIFIALGNYKFFTKFCTLVGRDEWLTDPLFKGAPFLIFPPRNAKAINLLAELFSTKSSSEWLTLLQSEGVPVAPVQTIDEFMKDPQVEANGMLIEQKEAGIGDVKEMGIPVKLENCNGKVKGPSPSLGQHNEEVLGAIGYSEKEIGRLIIEGVIGNQSKAL